jgi:hypothetical protein
LRASKSTGPVQSQLPQLPVSNTIHPHRVSQPIVQVDPTPEAMLESQNEYINLLSRIRDAARKAKIPVHGAFDMSSLAKAIEDQSDSESSYPTATTAFGTRSLNQLRHDMKVGAAGELFVRILPVVPPSKELIYICNRSTSFSNTSPLSHLDARLTSTRVIGQAVSATTSACIQPAATNFQSVTRSVNKQI